MRKILNIDTGKVTYVPSHYHPLTRNEVSLYDEFLSEVKTHGFEFARTNSIKNEVSKTQQTNSEFLETLLEIKKTEQSKSLKVPELPDYRAGGQRSKTVDCISEKGRMVAAESTSFVRTVLSGVVSEIMNGYKQILESTIEDKPQNDKSTKTQK